MKLCKVHKKCKDKKVSTVNLIVKIMIIIKNNNCVNINNNKEASNGNVYAMFYDTFQIKLLLYSRKSKKSETWIGKTIV